MYLTTKEKKKKKKKEELTMAISGKAAQFSSIYESHPPAMGTWCFPIILHGHPAVSHFSINFYYCPNTSPFPP